MTVVYLDATDRAAVADIRRELDLSLWATADMVLRIALHAYARELREATPEGADESPEGAEGPT